MTKRLIATFLMISSIPLLIVALTWALTLGSFDLFKAADSIAFLHATGLFIFLAAILAPAMEAGRED